LSLLSSLLPATSYLVCFISTKMNHTLTNGVLTSLDEYEIVLIPNYETNTTIKNRS
jgi:hypothetical protein